VPLIFDQKMSIILVAGSVTVTAGFDTPGDATQEAGGRAAGDLEVMPDAGLGKVPEERDRECADGAYLISQAYNPEYQVRWRWKPYSVAIWDNRCTRHYAVMDYQPCHHKMERAAIVGDKPY
jgi:hypothetical protein